jgi:hypothetical protein
MGTFVIYNLLTQVEAQYTYDGIRQWFKDNPDRNDCKTESVSVRRDHVKEDILKNAEAGAILKEDAQNSNFTKSLPKKTKKAKKVKKAAKTTTKTKKAAKKNK